MPLASAGRARPFPNGWREGSILAERLGRDLCDRAPRRAGRPVLGQSPLQGINAATPTPCASACAK